MRFRTNIAYILALANSGLAAAVLVPPRNLTFESLNNTALHLRTWPFETLDNTHPSAWVQTSTCCGYGQFTPAAVTAASGYWGLFDVPCLPDSWPVLAEWGYEFMNNANNIFPVCGNLTEANYSSPPSDRADALSRLALYWACRNADTRSTAHASASTPTISEIGHYFFAGLSAAFPSASAVVPGSEVGENINSIQAHIAASRGAARQYAVPFLIDFSPWLQGFITDYSSERFWGAASSPVGGHSVSLVRRTYFAAFMGGAGSLVAEAGAVNFFRGNVSRLGGGTGLFALSPLGAAGADIFAFSHPLSTPSSGEASTSTSTSDPLGGDESSTGADSEAVRGIPYVPVAIVSAQAHGMGLGYFYNSRAWDEFPLTDADLALNNWLMSLWPGAYNVESQDNTPRSETDYMVASPHGDSADILTPLNLTAPMLIDAYRVTVFAGMGPGDLDAALADVIVEYVAGGGTVILSANDVILATANGWFPPSFFGVTLPTSLSAYSVVGATHAVDAQTGWSAAPPGTTGAAFCAPQSPNGAGSWYIKVGGDPLSNIGWDGGVTDKCCSSSNSSCNWFPSEAQCKASLPILPLICRSCPVDAPAATPTGSRGTNEKGSGSSSMSDSGSMSGSYSWGIRTDANDVGCPAWPGPIGLTPVLPVHIVPVQLTTAEKLLTYTLSNGSSVLGATRNAVGAGAVVLITAPGSLVNGPLGFGVTSHLLDRITDDTCPVSLTSNITSDGTSAGVSLLVNRLPQGWVLTLINNGGVSKQQNASEVVDASAGRAVTVTLKPREGSAASAWVSTGVRTGNGTVDTRPLPVQSGQQVTVVVPAGQLCVVGLVLLT